MKFGLEWFRNGPEYFQNQFWSCRNPQKSTLDLKTEFRNFPPLQKTVFVHKSFFWSLISNPISQKLFLWTIRTILVFGKNWNLIGKLSSKSRFFGKSGFLRLLWKWVNSLGVDSEKVTSGGKLPQGLLFPKNDDFWNFGTCPFGENDGFPHIWSIWVQILYIFGTYLVRDGYLVGTWLVRGFDPNCRTQGPMRIILTLPAVPMAFVPPGLP